MPRSVHPTRSECNRQSGSGRSVPPGTAQRAVLRSKQASGLILQSVLRLVETLMDTDDGDDPSGNLGEVFFVAYTIGMCIFYNHSSPGASDEN
jgi:hypothetical protein